MVLQVPLVRNLESFRGNTLKCGNEGDMKVRMRRKLSNYEERDRTEAIG
jgi:hypothetical protein